MFTRNDIEKVLAQEHGHSWESARRAVYRYMLESEGTVKVRSPAWTTLFYGDIEPVTDWINGTGRYWLPKGARWKVQLPKVDTDTLRSFHNQTGWPHGL